MKRLVLILMMLATPVFSVQPDEVLDDPVLEQRARDLSTGLRCLVCRNESIDESNADLARDLRLLLRERLVAGDTDEQAIAFIVDRYGEYVLLKPTTSGSNLFLWLAGPIMLLIAAGVGLNFLRTRAKAHASVESTALSEDEKERLRRILED
ncbi:MULTISPECIES: cytochrome c-type biogenesis protein [unclassified Ruegeria]|uniref:cytochrome c-type biogenesis protein n=1 Tax=unclassified Ruegeria TaxID=2625375 RepID=UPI0014888CD9|nr:MULTISPECIES: cytochrome c-type biogenesis protein [unclassified Ruegeria]NOD75313.1 cytochrome C biogenesis protein CcdA [Ruegeria sp. HKCCD4332]NOD87274.1 cytochrome C biogenesis protein CcdA [Ruegeria sp. HKCCD4318]NOE12829.1 cytochrome C biogenesis protein CcdA [Ruegeria sp. HKCCD4318-2]NOG09004.1 cytochrome c-type biogenesis protein CcmH [Ruegeria sp. HKCCD4315]